MFIKATFADFSLLMLYGAHVGTSGCTVPLELHVLYICPLAMLEIEYFQIAGWQR
jgi:hypothetical protein